MLPNRVSIGFSIAVTIFVFLNPHLVEAQSVMEPFIVGGQYASIYRNPHSGLLCVTCLNDKDVLSSWICGSSILNQDILLTAAHCIYGCTKASKIAIHVGQEHRGRELASTSSSFIIHDKYDAMLSWYDIGLVRAKTQLKLSDRVKRIAIFETPPRSLTAHLTGWGLTDEKNKTGSKFLKQVTQNILKNENCEKAIGTLGPGTFCARGSGEIDTVARGDSGGALIIDDFIQIGIVSYKLPEVANQIIVYTDVAYFYKWIQANIRRLYCTD